MATVTGWVRGAPAGMERVGALVGRFTGISGSVVVRLIRKKQCWEKPRKGLQVVSPAVLSSPMSLSSFRRFAHSSSKNGNRVAAKAISQNAASKIAEQTEQEISPQENSKTKKNNAKNTKSSDNGAATTKSSPKNAKAAATTNSSPKNAKAAKDDGGKQTKASIAATAESSSLVKNEAVPQQEAEAKKAKTKTKKKAVPKESSQNSEPGKLSSDGKTVVVVESPTKAKTIEKYLGKNYVVVASYGHVRDLAARSGSVRPQDDFGLVWEVPEASSSYLNKIKAALNGAKALLLACDPDREGEAIAWHVHELLKMEGALKGLQVQRVTFNEITKPAVLAGVKSARGISQTLVDAYLARRALDYLIGFDISPLLWRKLPGSKSAGRVQSAALCLLAERESEIESFTPREYFTVEAELKGSGSTLPLPSRLVYYNGTKVEQFSLTSTDAEAAANYIRKCSLQVESVKRSLVKRNAPAPYITSTLQQDASGRLGFGATKTMALAQKLYEGVKLADEEVVGLITYMRTDSPQLSSTATEMIRSMAMERYGEDYVPKVPRKFKSKLKNAQEAHEAIRPTDIRRLPSSLSKVLEQDALRLYALIWRRTMACQLGQAVFNHITVDIEDTKGVVKLRSTASALEFLGYQIVSRDKDALVGEKEGEEEDEENAGVLPDVNAGTSASLIHVEHKRHQTEPLPRYTEGSLVKKLEELGIGRPSTYAIILKTLQTRQYIKTEKQRIFPEIRGRMVAAFLSHYFKSFVNYSFTAKMEEQLDNVSSGQLKWKDVLRQFWPEFHEKVKSTSEVPNQKVAAMLAEKFSTKLAGQSRTCPSCGTGKLELKLTRFGSGYFLGCNSYPTCRYVNNLDDEAESEEYDEGTPPKPKANIRLLGSDPKSGLPILCKSGPFGSYIQIGEDGKGKLKPKRIPIPHKIKSHEVDLETALKLAEYPITLGYTAEGKVVTVGLGKSGCYIRVSGYSVFVPTGLKVEELTVESALRIVKEGKEVRRKYRKPRQASFNSNE